MFRFTIILAKSPTCVSDQGQPDPGPQGVVVAEKIGKTSLAEYYIMGLCERLGKPAWWSSFSGWNIHQKNTLYIALLYFARQFTRDLQTSAPRIFAQLALFSSSETWILKIWPSGLNQIVIVYLVLCLFHNSPPYFQLGLALDTKVRDVRHHLITLWTSDFAKSNIPHHLMTVPQKQVP